MMSSSFLRGFALLALASTFGAVAVACNGNVIVDSGGCPSGQSKCDGVCVNLLTDIDNCGQCGSVCSEVCSNGVCKGGSGTTTDTGPSCNDFQIECSGLCVDPENDPQNCGGCGIDCGPGGYCDIGDCAFPPEPCVTCAEAITEKLGVPNVCAGTSASLYMNVVSCVCDGACGFACSDNVCNGANITPECQQCINDMVKGCGTPLMECENDI